jgi:hypothetical protein
MMPDEMKCPNCGHTAHSDSVDVGIGLMVRGNFHCDCGWEIDGPSDFGLTIEMEDRPFTTRAALTPEDRSAWERCHIGSCKRHKACMYVPCRAALTPEDRR